MRQRKVMFSSDLRWTALKRAGLAVGLALSLLLAMLWYGDPGQPIQPPNVSLPPPVVSALEPDMALQTAVEPAAPPTPAPAENEVAADAPSEPPKAVDKPAKPVSLQDGYFVQLGVFNDTENVSKVFENVTALGMSAHIQSRVVVGPFRDKREAEEARDRMKDVAQGFVLSPPQKAAKPSGKPKAKQKPRQRAK